MRNAVIVHGTPERDEFFDLASPSPSNAHWLPWLQKQMVMADYLVDTPEMPRAYAPDYPLWKRVFERYEINSDSVLVGHSCGGGFLLRWLSETDAAPKRVVLVAPWLDPFGGTCPDFFRFEIDRGLCRRTEMHLFESDNDMGSVIESVRRIRVALPDIHYRLIPNAGHFCVKDFGTDKFPVLAELALR